MSEEGSPGLRMPFFRVMAAMSRESHLKKKTNWRHLVIIRNHKEQCITQQSLKYALVQTLKEKAKRAAASFSTRLQTDTL